MSEVVSVERESRIDILNASFLISTPILAIIGMVWYYMEYGVSWIEPTIFAAMYFTTGLSITAGYHRLFSHRTHSAAWPLRLFYAIMAAGAFQNSAIKWCSDHRRHHLLTDSERDPYSVVRGFFWAHMGWVMVSESGEEVEKVEDLQNDPILLWQERHIFKIGAVSGIILPGIIGYFALGGFAGFMGGLVWGGLLRLVFVHHGTFLINSGAHVWGTQPYTIENTSKDLHLLSLFTFGEGFHNFHHAFQADYRNGHKWYHWDISKWWIKAFSWVGLTSDLHKVPQQTIESRRMTTTFEKQEKEVTNQEAIVVYRSNLADCIKLLRSSLKGLNEKRIEYKQERKAAIKDEIAKFEAGVKQAWTNFSTLLAAMKSGQPIAA